MVLISFIFCTVETHFCVHFKNCIIVSSIRKQLWKKTPKETNSFRLFRMPLLHIQPLHCFSSSVCVFVCVWVQTLDWQVPFFCASFCSAELSFRWILNEFPIFIPLDKRRFVSQTTGNLYISKVESLDKGNYSCIASSPSISKSVFSNYIPLVPLFER